MVDDADNRFFLLKALFSGGLAGMAGKSFVAPLDRVKILLQTRNIEYIDKGISNSLATIVRREGVYGLYRGNGVQMLRIFPYGAIQFSSYETFKRLFLKDETLAVGSMGHSKKFVAGSMGGVCAVVCTYPLDTVRAHLAYHTKVDDRYSGIRRAFSTILEEGGIKGLYRGLCPSVLAIIPQSGLTFFFFELLKTYILSNISFLRVPCSLMARESSVEDGLEIKECGSCDITENYCLTIPGKLLAGGVGGALAQSVCYPLDVARRRMQLGQGTRLFQLLVDTYRSHGVAKGLFRGMSVNYIRGVPLNAVSFSVYESCKQLLGISTSVKISV